MNKISSNTDKNHPSLGGAGGRLISGEIERGLSVNVIGATGLVGKALVRQLLDDARFEKVRIFVRRETGLQHSKLEQCIVDFGQPETWEKQLYCDVLFSALGTTLKQAGSKEKQWEIDFTFNLNFARKAKENGIKNYVLVSSLGANAKSSLFYTKMKGELDEAVSKIGFSNLVILRPASLTGPRENRRLAEEISVPILNILTRVIMKNYRPISDEIVAKAMINAVFSKNTNKTIYEGGEVFNLA